MVDVVLPIANGFYTLSSLPVSAQNCVNLYPHISEAPALNQEILMATPGITGVAELPAGGAFRGARQFAGKIYVVSGATLYSVGSGYAVSEVGTISGTGRVSMADNGHQLMILVPGGAGYILAADTLTAITDSDFRASGDPMYVAYVDGYFVCTTNQSSNFIVSELNDGLSWNALDVGTAESSPDAAIAPVVCKNQLFIVGSLTCEQFSNVGGPGFPFRRSGLFMDKGTQSAFSIASYSDTFMFIGGGENESPAVWALDGNTMVKRSTTAIDTLLQKLTEQELGGVFSWSYAQEGHYFVGFGLPDTTIVYDLTTNRWHERSSRSLVGSDYTDTHYRVGEFVRLGTNLLAADISGGRIGITDTDVYTEFGEATARTFTLQPLQNNMQPFFVPKLELTVESGVGLPDAPDPSVRLQISRDGGKTWGDERSRPMGKMGEYNRRAVWRRNGRSSRFDVYRFTMTDPVKTTVIQLTAQIEGVDDGAA